MLGYNTFLISMIPPPTVFLELTPINVSNIELPIAFLDHEHSVQNYVRNVRVNDLMQGKLFQRCTHLLNCHWAVM